MTDGTWNGGFVDGFGWMPAGVTIYATYGTNITTDGSVTLGSDHFRNFFDQFVADVNARIYAIEIGNSGGSTGNSGGSTTGTYCQACRSFDEVCGIRSPFTPLGEYLVKSNMNHDPSCPWHK